VILNRTSAGIAGVFGQLLQDDGSWIAYTLEHAYDLGDTFEPKIPDGTFACIRGMHQLQGLSELSDPFETFEIEVPGHSGLLFHTGNVNSDSAGCVLVGTELSNYRLINSAKAFNTFMAGLEGIAIFQLTVR
jgi:hypothetical protein